MKKLLVLLAMCGVPSAMAVPVVPNFTQGSMTSHTETTSTGTETLNSIDYNTGWQFWVTGTGIQHDGSSILPDAVTSNTNIDLLGSTGTTGQVTSGLDLSNTGNYTLTTPGAAFQMTSSYQGPGISNQTIIQRTTNITSVTDTTSIFSQ